MAKVFTYIVIMTLIMLLLFAGGFLESDQLGSADDLIIKNATSNEITFSDYQDTKIYSYVIVLIGIMAAAAVTGITASFFGGSVSSQVILLAQGIGAGTFLFGFVSALWNAINKVNAATCDSGICGVWVSWLIGLICLPIMAGYVWSIVEWMVGGD